MSNKLLGHASGLAASIALEKKTGWHDLPVMEIQSRLLKQHQLIEARHFAEIIKGIDP